MKIKLISAFWLFLLLCMADGVMAEENETGFLKRSIELDGQVYPYQVYVPPQYNASKQWPVILFLHGAGERGSDNVSQTKVGLGGAIRSNPNPWQAIVVFPQVAKEKSWSAPYNDVAMAALDATIEEFNIDDDRATLTGVSMGGRGVWQLAYQYPQRFAALVPVCGFVEGYGYYPEFLPASDISPYQILAQQLVHIPIWMFHGGADPVVPVEATREMAEALKQVSTKTRYSELPGVDHNAWDPAYAMDELAKWLLNQKRK